MFQANNDNSEGHQWVPITSQAITTVTTHQSWQRRSPNLSDSCNNKCFYHHTQSTLSLDTGMLKSALHVYSCQADEESHICSDEWNDWRHICCVLCRWWHVHPSGSQHKQPPFHHEMSHCRPQLKQPRQSTACLAHLCLQANHEVRNRVGRKGWILGKTTGTCEGDGKKSDSRNFQLHDPFLKQQGWTLRTQFFVDSGVKININYTPNTPFVLGNEKPPTISSRQGWTTTRTAPQGSMLKKEPHMFQELLKHWNTSEHRISKCFYSLNFQWSTGR